MKKMIQVFTLISLLFVNCLSLGSLHAQDKDELSVAIVQLVTHPSLDQIREGILESLQNNGYEIDKNLKVNYQNSEGDMSLLPNMAEMVVTEEPDLIFAITTPVAQSLKEATSEIPIIMAGITDPVSAGLVDSLEAPAGNGNITGVSDAAPLEAQFDLFMKLGLELNNLGILYTSSEDNARSEAEKAEVIAKEAGINVIVKTVDTAADVQMVAEDLASQVDAILIPTDNTLASSADLLVQVAQDAGIPLLPTFRDLVELGGLASVAIDQKAIGIQSGELGLKVIKENLNPGEVAIEFANKTENVFNQQVVEQLGLQISEDILKELTEVGGE